MLIKKGFFHELTSKILVISLCLVTIIWLFAFQAALLLNTFVVTFRLKVDSPLFVSLILHVICTLLSVVILGISALSKLVIFDDFIQLEASNSVDGLKILL